MSKRAQIRAPRSQINTRTPTHHWMLSALQRGDTIVEVLIAMSIISLTLVGSYQVAGFSTAGVQDSQERSQATTIAQSQVESLRAHGGIQTGDCFDQSTTPASLSSGRDCYYSKSSQSGCPDTDTYCYMVQITVDYAEAGNTTSPYLQTTYKVAVMWGSLRNSDANVTLYYRMAVSNPSYVAAVGGGGGGGAGAGAAIDGLPCTPLDPCSSPGGSKYHYAKTFTNNTDAGQVPPSSIVSCTWDWGDGTSTTYTAAQVGCHYGDSVGHYYEYPVQSAGLNQLRIPGGFKQLPAWPAACNNAGGLGFTYTASLTYTRNDGVPTTPGVFSFLQPQCW